MAFNKGSMPELIKDGQNGFIVEDVEEAVKILGKISKIDRQCCREIVEQRFSVDRMVDDYIKVYQQILNLKVRGNFIEKATDS